MCSFSSMILNDLRLKVVLVAFVSSSSFFAQESSRYVETNVGISYTEEIGGFPGISFLYGQRKFLSNTTFLDVQGGLALPSIVTMKVGCGYRSAVSGFSASTGVRIWPAHAYIQFGVPDNRCSKEVSKRVQRRLERRGKDSNDLMCGEWTMSLEIGTGNTWIEYGERDGYGVPRNALNISMSSYAIATVSHRWYFN